MLEQQVNQLSRHNRELENKVRDADANVQSLQRQLTDLTHQLERSHHTMDESTLSQRHAASEVDAAQNNARTMHQHLDNVLKKIKRILFSKKSI